MGLEFQQITGSEMSEIIYFNGRKYNSVSEMPSSVRQMYEKLNRIMIDENQDGVPDMIQSGGLSGVKQAFNMIKDISQMSSANGFQADKLSLVRITDSGIFVNGKVFKDTKEMPDSIREEFDRVVNSAQDGTEEIFDESWRQVDRSDFFNPHDDEILNRQMTRKLPGADSPIQMVDSNTRFIIVIAAAILIVGILIALWFLFV
jgi:hypothetical protein